MTKASNELCGSACVNYILKTNNNHTVCPTNLFWCCDLALFLMNAGYKVSLKCCNSRLYNDYKQYANSNFAFEGFLSIKKFLSKLDIIEECVSTSIIEQEVHQFDYCIYNVDSAIFSNRPNSDGHYILSTKENKTYYLINPLRNSYQKIPFNAQIIYDSIKDFGAWRILVLKK